MISPVALSKSPQQTADYYMKEEKNYYLSESGVGNSTQWLGKLAAKYNLEGEAVTQEMLEKVLLFMVTHAF